MQTKCVRQGQVEVGIVEHEGREFSALGATTIGRHVTGYTRLVDGAIHLSTWRGEPMLASRCEVVERFWSGTLALMFRLPRGRFVVGYALADDAMLFRGELLTNCDEDVARRHALMVAECFADLDADDQEAFDSESEEERLLDIEYRCPECGHEWQEQWSCACDSECPDCGTKNITALTWQEADE